MHLHYGYNNLHIPDPVVTMGTFDGVHLGHSRLLEVLRKRAKESGGESVVITFYPHPRQVLGSDKNSLLLLTTPEEKISLLEKCGIDHLVIVEFDTGFSNKAACDFIEEILIREIRARKLIVGFNHHFGKRGSGDYTSVQECAAKHRLEIEMVEAVEAGSGFISSSAIRDALLSGNLEEANSFLGYPYLLSGVIVEGKKLGRILGYPTANINVTDANKLVPANGVYAVEIIVGQAIHKGVMSIGVNPTVNKELSQRTIEVNIFDFTGDIYGHVVKVIFRHRLRDEMTFANLPDLAAQIEVDKKRAAEILG
jgi:riboflavin kinase/FMN adenylyltransferase